MADGEKTPDGELSIGGRERSKEENFLSVAALVNMGYMDPEGPTVKGVIKQRTLAAAIKDPEGQLAALQAGMVKGVAPVEHIKSAREGIYRIGINL